MQQPESKGYSEVQTVFLYVRQLPAFGWRLITADFAGPECKVSGHHERNVGFEVLDQSRVAIFGIDGAFPICKHFCINAVAAKGRQLQMRRCWQSEVWVEQGRYHSRYCQCLES